MVEVTAGPSPAVDGYGALVRGEAIAARLAQLADGGALQRTALQERLAGVGDGLGPHVERLRTLAAALPPRMRGRAHAPLPHRIGIVADRFLYSSLEGLAGFVPVTPANHADVLDAGVDCLLVASTWRGVDGESWRGLGTPGSRARRHLLDTVLPRFRDAGVPLVWYSKEDPPNYAQFVEVAAACDAVFTTAAEMVDRYRRDCPKATHVEAIPFGVNPLHHSPVGSRNTPDPTVYFAGSWHREKYPERARWGAELLRGVAATGRPLVVFDRNSGLRDPRYAFPGEFLPHLADAVDHAFLMDLQRVCDVAVNLNSVAGSATMYANRAIELQASGTVVLSNYSVGLNSRFPHVHLANSAIDVAGFLDTLGFAEQRRIQEDGIRAAFTSELSLYGLDRMLAAVGLAVPDRRIRALAVAKHPSAPLERAMAEQSCGPVPLLSREAYEAAGSDAHVVLDVDPAFAYGTHYVQDHLNAYKYADAAEVSKVPGGAEAGDPASHRMAPGPAPRGLGSRWVADGDGAPSAAHYAMDALQVSPAAREGIDVRTAGARDTPVLSVVVPVYNNGAHLVHKCIASLRRSSLFGTMEILLVDDGSTDPGTVGALEWLARSLPQVRLERLGAGGSGSASRPRNRGLELARGEFTTYLDPDNEAVQDGYARLVPLLRRHGVDFAIGNMVHWGTEYRLARYTGYLERAMPGPGPVYQPSHSTLETLAFRPMSIQALVARTGWLRGLGLTQPVGAVGQDSYFFQQLLFHTRSLAVLDQPIHVYYAAVEDSTVNSVGASFFRKYLLLEQPRTEWLRENGLMDGYRRTRLEQFFRDWYLRKLEKVPDDQRAEAEETLRRIAALYHEHVWEDPQVSSFVNAQEDPCPRP